MIYIFDTSSLIVTGHYFPERFPSFWKKFDAFVSNGNIVSVREVFNELNAQGVRPHLYDWIKSHQDKFFTPTAEETSFVNQIFVIPHFQNLVGTKERLQGRPVADPFVIAAARIKQGCAITEEVFKDNAAKIPNICQHFGIDYTNLEGFMKREEWQF